MKTFSDAPNWTCFTCKFSGEETFTLNDQECVECRRNHPGGGSFPVMNIHSYCWDGTVAREYINKLKEEK